MKRSFTKLLLPVLLLVSLAASAQLQDSDRLRWADRQITVDGNSEEWAHPLTNYNKETKLGYSIANDDKNLYILIESADQATTSQILANSLTISINKKGKKKSTTSLGFPLNDRGRIATDSNDMIQAEGFDKMPVGTISLNLANTYGILAASSTNKNKVYMYELAIPLSQLGLSIKQKKEVAFNFKINGYSNPNNDPYNLANRGNGGMTGGGRMPGMGGVIGIGGGMPRLGGTIQIGGRRGTQTGTRQQQLQTRKRPIDTQPVDFWVKYKLANNRSLT